jgi:hypothetical protein
VQEDTHTKKTKIPSTAACEKFHHISGFLCPRRHTKPFVSQSTHKREMTLAEERKTSKAITEIPVHEKSRLFI